MFFVLIFLASLKISPKLLFLISNSLPIRPRSTGSRLRTALLGLYIQQVNGLLEKMKLVTEKMENVVSKVDKGGKSGGT